MKASLVDPVLSRQLKSSSGAKAVGAVLTLRSAPSQPGDELTDQAVARLLAHAASKTEQKPEGVTVFHNLGAFMVSAPAKFVKTLIAQDDVESAVANEQPQSLFIAPVSSKSVQLKDIAARPPGRLVRPLAAVRTGGGKSVRAKRPG